MVAFPLGAYYDDSVYWQGRSFEQLQDQQAAIGVYQQLTTSAPDTYYGLQARKRLRALNVRVQTERHHPDRQPEFPELFSRLQQTLKPLLYQDMFLHIRKAFELHEVQLQEYAQKELAWAESLLQERLDPKRSPKAMIFGYYTLARCYAQIDEYLSAIQIVMKIESFSQETKAATLPYGVAHLKYPLHYWELIEQYAQKNALDPFLVAGVIRQESAYNPKALSYANARGLMQVIPETGRRVARQLGLKKYTTARLYDPETNIAIGTKYLAGLLEQFDGNLYRALAGYNAGPAATTKWWPEKGEVDHEEVVENITYRATRSYIKRVLRNQYNYQAIYGEQSPDGAMFTRE
jgi:soluble lytic murein transglycosylase